MTPRRVRRRRAKPHDPATNVPTVSDDLTLSHSPPCNVTLSAPAIAFVDPSTSILTSIQAPSLTQYTTSGNARSVPLTTQAVHALPHSSVLAVTALISPSVPRTFICDPSVARKVTVLFVHPISSAPISESSRVEATRSGPFQKPNFHGCVYAPITPTCP